MEINKKVRSRKLNSKVDLTAMVSVSFLLIIFFMVAGELRKPKVMDFTIPQGSCGPRKISCYSGGDTYTILLGENNKLISYSGFLEAPLNAPKKIGYGKSGIRQDLLIKNKSMMEYNSQLGKAFKGITVIIKPSKKSSYGNLVDILDEMKITGITSYSVLDEFTPEETKLLASK